MHRHAVDREGDGCEFDIVVRTAKWLAFLGDRGYEAALWFNNPLNWVRRHLGLGYWSLSAFLKNRVKKAVSFIGAFEEAVAAEAREHDCDGIICGHIHHAADRMIGGIHYLNCGDWVESCTAIVENAAGELRIVRWLEDQPATQPAGAVEFGGHRRPEPSTHAVVPMSAKTAP